MMWGHYYDSGLTVWMFVWPVLLLALLGLAIWAIARWAGRATGTFDASHIAHPSPLDVLKMRYARGEIDAATFEAMRERLDAPASGEASETRQPQTPVGV